MWEKDNNLPVKITFRAIFIHKLREKLYLARTHAGQLVWSACLSFALCVSRARLYTRISIQCAHCVLAQLVYALLADHKWYLWPASVQSETSFYREHVWTLVLQQNMGTAILEAGQSINTLSSKVIIAFWPFLSKITLHFRKSVNNCSPPGLMTVKMIKVSILLLKHLESSVLSIIFTFTKLSQICYYPFLYKLKVIITLIQ